MLVSLENLQVRLEFSILTRRLPHKKGLGGWLARSLHSHLTMSDLFSRVLFSFFAPFADHPSSSSFRSTFLPFFPPRKVLCSVEQGAQHKAWRGAVSGWTCPQNSGRKFLPEICVKKGQMSIRRAFWNSFSIFGSFGYCHTGLGRKCAINNFWTKKIRGGC